MSVWRLICRLLVFRFVVLVDNLVLDGFVDAFQKQGWGRRRKGAWRPQRWCEAVFRLRFGRCKLGSLKSWFLNWLS
ncbi:MAG: hypothetical protein ACKESB_01630 [Candidatus Hodgkinia cicadicola]